MLLQFSVNNFKSIKDTVTFSMATASKDNDNCFKVRGYELLNSAVIYGANASGKSNLLKAMAFMSNMVLNKHKIMQSTDEIPHHPFKLNSETEDASSSFEIVYFDNTNNIKYRYGFEIDDKTVYSEWLYADEKGKESKLFYREIDKDDYVNPTKFAEGYDFFNKKSSQIKISSNQLFIWKCDREDDGYISKSILAWFNRFNLIDGINHIGYINYTMNKMQKDDFKNEIIDLVKTADIGIDNLMLKEEKIPSDIMNSMPFSEDFIKDGKDSIPIIKTYHKKFDENNNEIDNVIFELDKEESLGTRKFFRMSAPILNTLKEGKILMIDELDASLHPMLTKHLIDLFHNKEINKKNAQLIFVTHDTNLLNKLTFRRDQIWLTEKDKYGATDIYSLAQFKNVRKD
ncbi:MAG: ATP-binding protein, partial [Campylobacterota bacterium]|nr:ATP-binding protein [Campylobacterota bacterium]